MDFKFLQKVGKNKMPKIGGGGENGTPETRFAKKVKCHDIYSL